MTTNKTRPLRVGLVVPHIFMQRQILPRVIFAPAKLALSLADGLQAQGADVSLFTPGPVDTLATNITADLSYFEAELAGRDDDYLDLLKKHPFTFITLARQAQAELIAKAFALANEDQLDVVHIYTNEEDLALPFAQLCSKPVVFTHHDPFNFLVKYKSVFPKYARLPWISMSYAQRAGMPKDTNWLANIYHGMDEPQLKPVANPSNDYVAYLGRIIQPKGVHLAIAAVQKYNQQHPGSKLKLKIAGKHYAGHKKDNYWQTQILPRIDGQEIEYLGHIDTAIKKQKLLANARALMVPSLFDEPFGMVLIESLACGTPVIGLDSGAIPEIITEGIGIICEKQVTDENTTLRLAEAISSIDKIKRQTCRQRYESEFTAERMCCQHLEVYQKLRQSPGRS